MKAIFAVALALCVPVCVAQQAVNPGAALLQDFEKRVDVYMKLHKSTASKLTLKPTESQAAVTARRTAFAAAIRDGRPQAAPGDIFTPEITAEFGRLIASVMQGKPGTRIRKSLRSAEPVQLKLKVNDSYPEKVPLQSTPPTLLLSLPKIPAGLEYRIIGHDLMLRDADANIVVDFAPNVLP